LHASDESFNISKVDLNDLGDKLFEKIFATLCERYELTDSEIDALEDMISEETCKVVMDGNKLKFIVPMWVENKDEVALDSFDLAELSYELRGEFDGDLLLKTLTEGELAMQSSLII